MTKRAGLVSSLAVQYIGTEAAEIVKQASLLFENRAVWQAVKQINHCYGEGWIGQRIVNVIKIHRIY